VSTIAPTFLAPTFMPAAHIPRPAAPRAAYMRRNELEQGDLALANLRRDLLLEDQATPVRNSHADIRIRARLEEQASPSVKVVRSLLAREGKFVVPTPMLAANIANVIVREQHAHYIRETVKWSLAMFDATTVSGYALPASIEEIGIRVEREITKLVGDDEITIKPALEAVHNVLAAVFGKQLRVTGWLPGNRVAEGKTVLELSGNACPKCTVNPTGYKVGDKRNIARCLNSEDCGFVAA